MRNTRWVILASIALIAILGIASFNAVIRRADNYSFYPPYSSLNSEGLGLRAYYEALPRLGLNVSRNYRPFLRLAGQTGTVIYAGPNLGEFRSRSEKDLEQFERVAEGGARVLILFEDKETRYEKILAAQAGDKPSPQKAPAAGQEKKPEVDTLLTRWGVAEAEVDIPDVKRHPEIAGLTPSVVRRDVRWHFEKWDPRWMVRFGGSDGKPVLLERRFGRGSIGLLAGAEAFTNQRLVTKPDAPLVATTMMGPSPVIFDEAHLGVAEVDTIAGLARQHQLEWVLLGFLALAGLYVWRNATSFIPPVKGPSNASTIKGRDAHSALTSLLAQSVRRETLLKEIVSEWRQSKNYVAATPFNDEDLEQLVRTPIAAAGQTYSSLAKKKSVSSTKRSLSQQDVPLSQA